MAGVITQRKMMQHVNLLLISTNKGDARWNRDPSVYHGLDCMDKFMEVMGPLNTEIREVFHKTISMKSSPGNNSGNTHMPANAIAAWRNLAGKKERKSVITTT